MLLSINLLGQLGDCEWCLILEAKVWTNLWRTTQLALLSVVLVSVMLTRAREKWTANLYI
jgi:hypothetical protein